VARTGDVLVLDTFITDSPGREGSSFADLELEPGSVVSVVLLDQYRQLGNHVTEFHLSDPLPIGAGWQPAVNTDVSGVCG
jgi:hypothetical protein